MLAAIGNGAIFYWGVQFLQPHFSPWQTGRPLKMLRVGIAGHLENLLGGRHVGVRAEALAVAVVAIKLY